MKKYKYLIAALGIVLLMSFIVKPKPVKVYLIGDSTVADYTLDEGYLQKKYPITGWGQVFQQFLKKRQFKKIKQAD